MDILKKILGVPAKLLVPKQIPKVKYLTRLPSIINYNKLSRNSTFLKAAKIKNKSNSHKFMLCRISHNYVHCPWKEVPPLQSLLHIL